MLFTRKLLTYSNITDEIKLVASLGYAKEESLFYPAVNKNKLTDSAYFYTLYPKDSRYLNLDEMPRFFKSICNVRDGALNYSLDGTAVVQMPLNQDYEIQVAKNSKGEIKVYCEADLIL